MNLELTILTELESAYPRQLKMPVLTAGVQLASDGASATSIERSVQVLERKGQVRIYEGEDVTRVKITSEGLDRLVDAR